MSEAALSTQASSGFKTFVRARLASGLAIAPLGVWTVAHIWNNLAALKGGPEWEKSVTEYKSPVALGVTSLIVLAPLVLHTVWGIGRLRTSRPNNAGYGYFANLKYLLQRASAVGVLAFLCAHIWLAFLSPRIMEGHPETFADISHEMYEHIPTLVVYLLGTLGVSYHLANGIHTAAMGFGLVESRKALRKLDGVTLVFFALLLGMSWTVVYALYSAGAAAAH